MSESTLLRSSKKSLPLSRKEIRKILLGLLFISPWLIGFLWLTVYPLFASLYYSFTEYQILTSPQWIGFENYRAMFQDKLFWKSVYNTLYYVAVSVSIGTVISILLALLLNLKVRGISIYRTAYYIPNVVPAVASVFLWAWILHPTAGPVNFLFSLVGIQGPNWFGNPNWTKPALIILGLWGLGGGTIIYLAGLQDIPVHLYESADLDGANAIQKTFNITLPLLTPTILFNLVMGLINGFQYFTQAFVGSGLSGNPGYGAVGGPLNSMLFYNLYLYQNGFSYFKMGYASAMAWVLLIFVLLVTLLIFKLTGRFVHMAADTPTNSLSIMDQDALKMRRRHQTLNLLSSIGKHAMLVLFGLLFVLPLYWMVSSALKPNTEMFSLPPTWVPSQLLWQRFSDAFNYIPFALYTSNSLYIAIYNVVATVVSCLIVAYGFSCLEWKGRDAIFFLVLATLMLPFQVTLIPQYVIFSKLHWVGTFLPLTLPAWFGSPFLIFLLRQFMMTIPKDLLDAANIDGANDLQILWWIITPLTRPALATVAIFTFMGNWNDFFWPLIFLTDAHKFTLPLGLYNFIGSVARTEWGLLLAASTMMTLPPVILFFFAQRTFIQGITVTGMKG